MYSSSKYDPKLECAPGAIENRDLLVPLDRFLNDGDAQNPENLVIRHDINQREQVKIVNKAIWDLFIAKYGGGPEIKKFSIEEKTRSAITKKIIEIYFNKVINNIYLSTT